MSTTTHIPAPKLATTFAGRDNSADLSPRLVTERWPRDLDGNHAGPELLAARETYIEKLIPMIFRTPINATGANVAAALAGARKVALEAFDQVRGLSMAETPAEIAFRTQREQSAKVAAEIQARMAAARLEAAAKVAEIKEKWPQLASETIEVYRRRIWQHLDALTKIHTKGNLAPFNPSAVGL